MKKSDLREIIKEELIKEMSGQKAFEEVIKYLRTKIYTKLNNDDLYDLNVKLKDWFNKNV